MKPAVDKTVQDLLISKLKDIESHFGCDAISYFGSIVDGNENSVLNIIAVSYTHLTLPTKRIV